jgi:hypothetical protein
MFFVNIAKKQIERELGGNFACNYKIKWNDESRKFYYEYDLKEKINEVIKNEK